MCFCSSILVLSVVLMVVLLMIKAFVNLIRGLLIDESMNEKEKKRYDAVYLYFFIPVFIIGIIACINFQNNYKVYQDCFNNQKKVSIGLEHYRSLHDGLYPASLDKLYYDNSISVKCYKAQVYKVSDDRKRYTIFCSGHVHGGAGIRPDYPRYSSEKGREAPFPFLPFVNMKE